MKNRTSLEKLYERCKIHAKRKGYNQIAEDFASWQTIKYLDGKSQKQTISQSFIDYLREQNDFARRSISFEDLSRIGTNTNEPSDQQYSKYNNYKFNERIELHYKTTECDFDELSEYADVFRRGRISFKNIKHQLIFEMYINDYTMLEIANLLGLTESRISQLFKLIKKEILNQLGLKIIKEKIELNETEFKINWINF